MLLVKGKIFQKSHLGKISMTFNTFNRESKLKRLIILQSLPPISPKNSVFLIYLRMLSFFLNELQLDQCEITDATQAEITDLLAWRAHKDPRGHKPVTRCHGSLAELGWKGGQRSDIAAGWHSHCKGLTWCWVLGAWGMAGGTARKGHRTGYWLDSAGPVTG